MRRFLQNRTVRGLAIVQFKVTQYLKYGTRLIWLVYRKSQTVVVHTPTGSKTVDIDGVFNAAACFHSRFSQVEI